MRAGEADRDRASAKSLRRGFSENSSGPPVCVELGTFEPLARGGGIVLGTLVFAGQQ